MKKIRAFYKRELAYGYLCIKTEDEDGHLLPSPIFTFDFDGGGTYCFTYRADIMNDFILKIEWPEDRDDNTNK